MLTFYKSTFSSCSSNIKSFPSIEAKKKKFSLYNECCIISNYQPIGCGCTTDVKTWSGCMTDAKAGSGCITDVKTGSGCMADVKTGSDCMADVKKRKWLYGICENYLLWLCIDLPYFGEAANINFQVFGWTVQGSNPPPPTLKVNTILQHCEDHRGSLYGLICFVLLKKHILYNTY